MDFPTSSLVLTRLRPPSLRSRFIARMRLVEALAQDRTPKLILVCAPAGYGKTTLLAEWAQSLVQRGTAVAWLALDPGDDHPIPFGSYLVASLLQALGPISELTQLAQLLRSSPEIDLKQVLPSIINAVISCDRDCMLILDDYHLIGSPAVHSAVAFLLDRAPENLCVAIGSRSDPPLPLARWRARGKLVEIRAANLRFTTDETAQFLNEIMRLDLPQQAVATLEERTEGWAAGLQLAALSLAGRADQERLIDAFSGSHRYLVDYLMEEVVERQPEEVQSFLVLTSILERMSAPLCDALLGKAAQSEAILKDLEQANLFVVALDEQGDWYRYHHLFRDFLQTRLKKNAPERVSALHRAACEWYANHAYLREAAQHALRTADWEYAAAFVEQHSFTMIVHSDIATIYEWCAAFPEEVMQAHPMLCLQQGLALAYRFRRRNRGRVEERLLQADRAIAILDGMEAALGLSDMAGVVRTFLAMAPDPAADPREQLKLAQAMLDCYPEGNPGQFSGLLVAGYAHLALQDVQAAHHAFETARQMALREHLYFGIVESTFHLARLAHSQGQLHRAMEICRQGQADVADLMAHPEQDLPALGCLDVELGCIFLEQNHLEDAEQHLLHGLDLMGWSMNPYYLMTACLALFRLYEVQDRLAEGEKYLDTLEAVWPDITFCTQGLRILRARKNRPGDAETMKKQSAWYQEFSPALGEHERLPGMGQIGAAEAYYLAHLTWARMQIASGNLEAARLYLERQLPLAQAQGLKTRVIELSLLEAMAAHAEGDGQQSLTALMQALEAGQSEGFIRTFDQGSPLPGMLLEAARIGIHREYAEQLLSVIGPPGATKISQEGDSLNQDKAVRSSISMLGLAERLSERELEVLRRIAQGATNQQIAEELVITVGTVKSHINHILGKLDTHNRTEAVARARQLGLLDF